MHRPWYSGATRGQWLALAAALLGWAFDGFEQGIFPLVARPALIELVGLGELDRASRDPGSSEDLQREAKALVDAAVRRWNGVLSAFFLIRAAAGGVFFGWLGDRRAVCAMVFSVLTYALFTGFCGFAQAPWQLAGLRFIAALGMGGEWSLGVALVMETWSAHARPVLAGLIGAAANVGFLCAAGLSLLFPPVEYWRVLLVLCVLPALDVSVAHLRSRVETLGACGGDGTTTACARHLRAGDAAPVPPCAALAAVALLATWGAIQWIPLWVGQMTNGEPRYAAPLAQACSAFGASVGAFLGAFLGDRFRRRVGYFGLCLVALAVCQFLFFGLANGPFTVWLLALIVLVGGCTAAFYGWLPLYLPELFPTRIRATGQGFCYNFGRTLAAVGVVLTTFLIDVGGHYAQACSLICLVYLVGLVLAWFMPETKGQPLPE